VGFGCTEVQISCNQNPQAKEAAEKVLSVVIPSAARDLLFRKSQEKCTFLGQNPPSE
jgi:hypothetical protein